LVTTSKRVCLGARIAGEDVPNYRCKSSLDSLRLFTGLTGK